MDIFSSTIRRVMTSIGVLGAAAARLWRLVLHLFLIEERRRSEHLRNEGSEIQNIEKYEKLVTRYAKSATALGRDPREVDAMVEELMHLRLQAYLRLHTIPNAKSKHKADVREIKKWDFANRRLDERRQIPDRRSL